jgi:dolichol-phosphate mannosyltransferase
VGRFVFRRYCERAACDGGDPYDALEYRFQKALAKMANDRPLRVFIATAMGPLADVVIFIVAIRAGLAVSPAHIMSFACATVLNGLLTVRSAVAFQGRERDLRLYGHLLVVSLAVLSVRGGVLALLIGWGWSAQWAILFAVAVTLVLMRAGISLCLSTGVWSLGSGVNWRALAVALVVCATLLRLIYCGQIELLPEETYYWNYSRHLDLGYLDHPPMVAWLIHAGTTVFGESEFGVRSGAILCGAIASLYVYRLTRELFDDASALVALVLMQTLPFFFFSGIMMTPDAPLTAAWAALLYYLQQALIAGRARAWWRAGLCLGLGLLSKYTILMLAPVAFIFMVWDAQARHWLRHWVPYTALALALAIFSPVIFWNATHEWASFAFQTSRRLAEAPRFSLHKLILSALVLLTPVGALSLGVTLWGKSAAPDGNEGVEAQRRRHFMQLSVLVPLGVFFAFSLRHEVKLDWTGTLWMAALPALAHAAVAARETTSSGSRAWTRAAWPPTLVILVLIYGAALHYLVLGLPGVGYGPHMEVVPVGWRDLGKQLAAIEDGIREKTGTEPLVVGMERYAVASELAFYTPDRKRAVSQTASDHLFGGVGLMYERWFPSRAQAGRTLLLIGFKPEDLVGPDIESRAQRLGPLKDGVLTRDGRVIRRYYYRLAYNYRPAATDH